MLSMSFLVSLGAFMLERMEGNFERFTSKEYVILRVRSCWERQKIKRLKFNGWMLIMNRGEVENSNIDGR